MVVVITYGASLGLAVPAWQPLTVGLSISPASIEHAVRCCASHRVTIFFFLWLLLIAFDLNGFSDSEELGSSSCRSLHCWLLSRRPHTGSPAVTLQVEFQLKKHYDDKTSIAARGELIQPVHLTAAPEHVWDAGDRFDIIFPI
jgi:hypothetical protein